MLLDGSRSTELTREQEEIAAIMAAGRDSRLHLDTAAARLSLWDRPTSTIHVASPRLVQLRGRYDARFHRVHRGDVVHVEVAGGASIPCTEPLETIRCCGVAHTDMQIAAMLRAGVYERRFSLDDVQAHLRASSGLPGVAVARRGLALRRDGSAGTKCWSEDHVHQAWERHGGPHPLVNVRGCTAITDYEPDFAFVEELVILEVDGDQHYDDPIQAALDRERDQLLIAAGWIVIRVYWRRVWSHLPMVLDAVRDALQSRRTGRDSRLRLSTYDILRCR